MIPEKLWPSIMPKENLIVWFSHAATKIEPGKVQEFPNVVISALPVVTAINMKPLYLSLRKSKCSTVS